MTHPHLLALDFDGVVIDTDDATRRSVLELYARWGVAPPVDLDDRIRGDVGRPVRTAGLVDPLAAATGIDVAVLDATRRHVRSRMLRYQGARAGLTGLVHEARARRVRVIIVTNSDRRRVLRWLRSFGLASVVSGVSSPDRGLRAKPAPDLYLAAMAATSTAPEHVLAVEDSPLGCLAAVRSGARCVAAPTGTTAGMAFPRGCETVRALDDVRRWL